MASPPPHEPGPPPRHCTDLRPSPHVAARQLVTVFSAPNYCGEFDNAGAMMSVDETLMCSFQARRRRRPSPQAAASPRPRPPPGRPAPPRPPRAGPRRRPPRGRLRPALSSLAWCCRPPPRCLSRATARRAADFEAGGEATPLGSSGAGQPRRRLAARQESQGHVRPLTASTGSAVLTPGRACMWVSAENLKARKIDSRACLS